MCSQTCGVLSVMGRVLLVGVFISGAVGNKIPNFSGVVKYMEAHGVPAPTVLLPIAIAVLIVGSVLVAVGFKAKVGAGLLLAFLIAATYYFHAFWTFEDPVARAQQTIQFMKNLSMAGAMLFIIANGSGAWSWDNRQCVVGEATA